MGDILAFLTTVLIIVFVIGFAYFTTKWMGSKMGMQSNSQNMKVIEKMMITPDKSLVIVEIGKKLMVLGMSANSVEKICDIDDDMELEFKEINPIDFGDIFKEKLKNGFNNKKNASTEYRGSDEIQNIEE